MPTRYDIYARLEPHPQRRSFAAGFAAAIHDPVWFLARQWLMGEHQGENATTPVLVQYAIHRTPIQPLDGGSGFDPTIIPAEGMVESEANDWWTMGRRVRIGSRVVQDSGLTLALAAQRAELDLEQARARYLLPAIPPYERFAGRFDGLALWQDRVDLVLADALFTGFGIPLDGPRLWDPAELSYSAEFPVEDANGPRLLKLPRHRGGQVDWFSADSQGADAGFEPAVVTESVTVYPAPLQYPGAPLSRWWEIEDAAVDIGGYPPDTSHFPTTLLIDLISSHSDDWFLFPVDTRTGHIITLRNVIVTDSFGEVYTVKPPQEDWCLFKTTGLDRDSLVLWLKALNPLQGQPMENVLLGLDEYSNYLWAVERRTAGREMIPPRRSVGQENANPPLNRGDANTTSSTKAFIYIPGKDVLPFWHPYEMVEMPEGDQPRRRFLQSRLVDLARVQPELMPAAQAELLRLHIGASEVIHQIEPSTVPSIGIELERRFMLARDVQGRPILWVQRQRKPFLTPPGRTMRFDVMEDKRV